MIIRLALSAALIFTYVLAFGSTIWTSFYPEAVTRYGCKVEPVTMQNGNEPARNVYIAEAWAERVAQLGGWKMEISTQPYTSKGRYKALKACAAWMDEADRRVLAAAPIRVNQHKEQ